MNQDKATVAELLTATETGAFLRVKTSTIYEWVKQDRIRCRRAGSRLRFRREDLVAFVEGRGGSDA